MSPLRPAEPGDLARLRTIQGAALSAPWPDVLEAATAGAARSLVVTPEGRTEPVGYAVALDAQDPAYVPEIAVAPGHQREGHGTALLEGLCARLAADGHGAVRLTARADDGRARGFYAARGFEAIEDLPGHYDDGDGVLYERRLGVEG